MRSSGLPNGDEHNTERQLKISQVNLYIYIISSLSFSQKTNQLYSQYLLSFWSGLPCNTAKPTQTKKGICICTVALWSYSQLWMLEGRENEGINIFAWNAKYINVFECSFIVWNKGSSSPLSYFVRQACWRWGLSINALRINAFDTLHSMIFAMYCICMLLLSEG